MMKILQVSPYLDQTLGGQERHVLALSKTLSSFGHKVTILTCQSNLTESPQNFTVSTIHSGNLLGLRLISLKELLCFLSENQFDVCHLHYQTLFGDMVLLATRLHGLPTVTTLHTQIVRSLPARFFWDRVSLRIISVLSRKVVCLSPKIMEQLVQRGIEPSKCVSIPNAIDVKSLTNKFQKIRRDLYEPEFDLLFVGRLEQRKGIKWLLQALALLHKKGKKVTLKIVGQGPLKDELPKIISANDLSQHVTVLGYVSDEELLKLFLLTKCVVTPSLYEGVPGVALEAMAAKKPLIISNIPGLAELVTNEVNGLVVDPLDTNGLASAIERISANPDYLGSFSAFNEAILYRFDWSVVAQSVLETYQKALDDDFS